MEPPNKRARLEVSCVDMPLTELGTVSTYATFEHQGISSIAVDANTGTKYVTGFLCFKSGHHSVINRITDGGVVDTLAGGEAPGRKDGVGAAASFNSPCGIAITADGTTLFVADTRNHRIRQVDIATKTVSTIAGNGQGFADGIGQSAKFWFPYDIAVSRDGTTLFVADTRNRRVRQIDIATKTVSTIAGNGTSSRTDGVGEAASFQRIRAIALNSNATMLYVSDDNSVRQVNIGTGAVKTLAGRVCAGYADANGESALFDAVRGIALSSDEETLFVVDSKAA